MLSTGTILGPLQSLTISHNLSQSHNAGICMQNVQHLSVPLAEKSRIRGSSPWFGHEQDGTDVSGTPTSARRAPAEELRCVVVVMSWARGFVVRTVFPWVASRASMLYLAVYIL